MNIFNNKLSFVHKDSLEFCIRAIIALLLDSSNYAQAGYMKRVLESVVIEDKALFVKLSKTVEIWGGSGAVWEVFIQNREREKVFQETMIKFADLLKDNGVSNYGIRSIKSLFEKQLQILNKPLPTCR